MPHVVWMTTPAPDSKVRNILPKNGPLVAVLVPLSPLMAAVLKAFTPLCQKSNGSGEELGEHRQPHTLRFGKGP